VAERVAGSRIFGVGKGESRELDISETKMSLAFPFPGPGLARCGGRRKEAGGTGRSGQNRTPSKKVEPDPQQVIVSLSFPISPSQPVGRLRRKQK